MRLAYTVSACALVITACANPTSDPTPTPRGVVFEGHHYFLTEMAESWTVAEAEAVADGGHLAAVGSQAEQDFLTTQFCADAVPVWIGGERAGSTFAWTTGESFSYTAWSRGEPNNAGGDENFIAMNWHFAEGNDVRGNWNDAPNDGSRNFPGTTDGPYYGIIEVP